MAIMFGAPDFAPLLLVASLVAFLRARSFARTVTVVVIVLVAGSIDLGVGFGVIDAFTAVGLLSVAIFSFVGSEYRMREAVERTLRDEEYRQRRPRHPDGW